MKTAALHKLSSKTVPPSSSTNPAKSLMFSEDDKSQIGRSIMKTECKVKAYGRTRAHDCPNAPKGVERQKVRTTTLEPSLPLYS
jgi:hypothetical protein